MTRISLGYFIMAGLVLWGIPDTIVAGPRAIEYTVAALVPLWFVVRSGSSPASSPHRYLSTASCAVLAIFSIAYLVWDATYGRQLLQFNMFLFHGAGAEQLIQDYNATVGKGGGVADLLGYIFTLLPLGLIDSASNTSRYGRWILWIIALLLLFYETGSGRGFVLMVVIAIVLRRTSNWRRAVLGAGLGLAAFSIASSFRGDSGNVQSPLLSGTITPFINLGMMLNAHCGTAPWYDFIGEFLKKFVPAFLVPKKVFSFNMEMSMCIYPSVDNTVDSVSIFTWLGEIFYFTPSLVTAISAGALLGALSRAVNRLFVKNEMYSARLFSGFLCILMPRSRTQDIFTFLIAQLIFLAVIWPWVCNLTRTLDRFLVPVRAARVQTEPERELL